MKRNFTGHTLARIAVEVGEDADFKLLVESKTCNWNEKYKEDLAIFWSVSNERYEKYREDPAIFWAVSNERFERVKILLECPEVDKTLKNCNGHSLEKVVRLVYRSQPYLYLILKNEQRQSARGTGGVQRNPAVDPRDDRVRLPGTDVRLQGTAVGEPSAETEDRKE